MPTLSDLNDLRTVLGRLDAERPAAQGREELGRTEYADRGDDFLDRLDLDLRSRRGKCRLLVTGQIGVGKSSELWHYTNRARSGGESGFIVHCDLEREESPEHCAATGVLLTMLRDCWSAIRSYLSPHNQVLPPHLRTIRDEILSRLVDFLGGRRLPDSSEVNFLFGGMDFPVSVAEHRKDAALALVLGKAAQHEAVSEPKDRFGVAPDSLVSLLNRLLRWLATRFGKPPSLIVDHVDKIRNRDSAEDVLVRAFTHWNRLEASIVMTAPFEFTLGELRNSIESKWGRPLVLYPVDSPELAGGPIRSIYVSIAQGAGLSRLVPQESLRVLAHYSGGILRTYVQLLIAALKEAHFAKHDVVEHSDAMAVIHGHELAYQDYDLRDFQLLDEVVGSGTGLRNATVLLRSPIGLIVREGTAGEQRLDVHPLARSALERYRQKRKATA